MSANAELKQWIKNYDQLKEELKAAFYFGNEEMIDDLSKRLITTQRMIAECVALEKDKDTNASGSAMRFHATVSPDVKVSK